MNTREVEQILETAFEFLGYSYENKEDVELMSNCTKYVHNSIPAFIKEDIDMFRDINKQLTNKLEFVNRSVVTLMTEVLDHYNKTEVVLLETEDENCWIDVDKDTYATKVTIEEGDIIVYDNLGTRYYAEQSGVDMPELLYRILDTLENELSEKSEK